MDPSLLFNQSQSGFGQANAESLEMLTKALASNVPDQGVDAGTFTGGRALTPESMDQTLVNVLHNQDEARLFQRLKKKPIKSVIHQWNYRDEVGSDDGAWISEGGETPEATQGIARRFAQAKFLQTRRQVTLQAAVTNMIEDAVAIEKNAGTLWIIRNIERVLFNGNSALYPNQPDGLDAQIDGTGLGARNSVTPNPSNSNAGGTIIDLRGQSAASSQFETSLNEGTRAIRNNFGRASHFFGSTQVMLDVQALIRDRIRFQAGDGQLGTGIFKKYPTPFGDPELVDNIFIQEGTTPRTASSVTNAPPAPTSITAAVGAQTGSLFQAADAGDYYYAVAASNDAGDSSAVEVTGNPITVTGAGDGVSLTINRGTVTTLNKPTAYKIYRSKKDAANSDDMRLMTTIVAADAATTVFIDLNEDLPGTSKGYLLTLDPMFDAIEWFQFLPLMKFELYPTNAAVYPFLMLLFGALAVKKPPQHCIIKNIAPDNLGWF